MLNPWQHLTQAQVEGHEVRGQFAGLDPQGISVYVDGILGLIPESHLPPLVHGSELQNECFPLLVLEVDESAGRLLLSHRLALHKRKQEAERWATLIPKLSRRIDRLKGTDLPDEAD